MGVLRRRATKDASLCHVRIQWRGSHPKARYRACNKNQIAGTLIFYFLAIGTVKNVCCLSSPVYGILLWQHKQSEAGSAAPYPVIATLLPNLRYLLIPFEIWHPCVVVVLLGFSHPSQAPLVLWHLHECLQPYSALCNWLNFSGRGRRVVSQRWNGGEA